MSYTALTVLGFSLIFFIHDARLVAGVFLQKRNFRKAEHAFFGFCCGNYDSRVRMVAAYSVNRGSLGLGNMELCARRDGGLSPADSFLCFLTK